MDKDMSEVRKSHARAERKPFQEEGTALGQEQDWHVYDEAK